MRRLIAVLAVLALAGCHDHPNPNPTPSSSPSVSPSTSPSASPSPNVSPSTSPSVSPSATPSPNPAGFPTPATTGVPAGTTLTDSGTCTLGAGTYTARRWTCRVHVAGAVTIRGSELLAGVQVDSGSLVIEDSTLGPESGCGGSNMPVLAYANYTARRVEVRNSSEGARSEGPNILIEDSFFGMCELPDPAHGDAFQGCFTPCANEGPNVNNRFVHNTVDMPDGAAREGITAPIFWSDGSVDGLVVRDNLLAGGGGTIRLLSGANHVVTGNRIVDGSWRWWPVDVTSCGTGTWADNRLVTLGAVGSVASTGAEVACAKH